MWSRPRKALTAMWPKHMREFTINNRKIQIRYSKHVSEFEVQAHLFSTLRKLGYNIRGEVKAYDVGGSKKKTYCRFDLVIFNRNRWNENHPILIIEVKRKRHRNKGLKSQINKYAKFGIPVIVYYSFKDITMVLEKLKNLVNGGINVPQPFS